jgi:hypothetical protein
MFHECGLWTSHVCLVEEDKNDIDTTCAQLERYIPIETIMLGHVYVDYG